MTRKSSRVGGRGSFGTDPILLVGCSIIRRGARKVKEGGNRRRRKRVKQAEKFIDHGHLTQFDYFAEGGKKRKVERVEDTANFSMFGTLAKWRQGLPPRRLFLDACCLALE